MGFFSAFRTLKNKLLTRYSELGVYNSVFTAFGNDIYESDIVRSCIRPLAEHTSKANAVCSDSRIQRLLNYRPNMYMNGKDFLSKVRTKLEITNTAFIYIERDDRDKVIGFYPVPYQSFEAVEYMDELYIRFRFAGNLERELVFSWKDLAVLRKDYNKSDIAGDDNTALFPNLELINTTNQGIGNAVKATSNLRGILKSTKAILSPEDIKKSKETFVKDYLNLNNEGGIAALDATMEFTPITMNPTVTNWATLKEFRENVYRYYGISEAIITGNYTEQQMEAFYEARIEPFLVALSLELTTKVFTDRELGYQNHIMYESNRLQFASNATKLNMVQLVDRGALTPNEWRMIFNLAPVEGGDVPIRRLDTATVNEHNIQAQNDATVEVKPVEDEQQEGTQTEGTTTEESEK